MTTKPKQNNTTTKPMENKIYQQCREEAKEILRNKAKKANQKLIIFNEEELAQLTAELYAQKFADWIQPIDEKKNYYQISFDLNQWVKIHSDRGPRDKIGTTAQLHEKFVEENKGGGDE